MPDQEAIEVAQADLSDVSESDSSEAVESGEQQETQEGQAAEVSEQPEGEETSKETETKSQRRRRMRREKEAETNERVRALERENAKLKEAQARLKRPNRHEYNDPTEYAADLAAFKVREQDTQAQSERINQEYEAANGDERSSFQAAATDFTAEGAEKYPDFSEVVNRNPDAGGPAITPIMAEALFESDAGVDVAYYLAKNTAESVKISQMSPVAQARAIFNLEAKVTKPKPPVQSKAPAPVKPVKGGSTAAQKPVTEMSMSEYAAYRQKQMNGG